MTAPEWTHADTKAQITAWVNATTEQRDAAFLDLLAAACAIAEFRHNEMMIETLRDLAVKRDAS